VAAFDVGHDKLNMTVVHTIRVVVIPLPQSFSSTISNHGRGGVQHDRGASF